MRPSLDGFEASPRTLVPDILSPFPSNPKEPSYRGPIRGPILGPRPLTPRNELFSSPCGPWLSIYETLSPFAHRPHFHTHPPSLSLGVYFLSSRTRAFNHERNIVAIPHCLSSSALDGSREPRRDVGRTGEISKDWLASTGKYIQGRDAKVPAAQRNSRCLMPLRQARFLRRLDFLRF
jgi:hypothetical protein